MKKLHLSLFLLTVSLLSISQTEQPPLALEINGVSGIFFTMQRARLDAQLIEKGFEYYNLYLNAEKKIKRLENIIELDSIEISALEQSLFNSDVSVSKHHELLGDEMLRSERYKKQYKSERRKKNLVIIGSSIIVGGLIYNSIR